MAEIKDATTPVQTGDQLTTKAPEVEWADAAQAAIAANPSRETVRAQLGKPHNGVPLTELPAEQVEKILDDRVARLEQMPEVRTALATSARYLERTCRALLATVPAGSENAELVAGVCEPVLGGPQPGLDGTSTNALDPLFVSNPEAGSVQTFGTTVGQTTAATGTRSDQVGPYADGYRFPDPTSGPLFVEHPAGQELHATVRDGLTQRLGYVPHRDVVRLVAEHTQTRPDGRVSIPDRAGVIALYAETYGIDPSQGQVIIAKEGERYADVIEQNFHFGEQGMPWGARGLLIRTIMAMNGMQPHHNMEMPGVVVIPANEADFAERALAQNGFAGQETRRFAGSTVEPADQAKTVASYLTRLLNRPVTTDEVQAMFSDATMRPTAGRAYARTEADQSWPRDAILEAYQDVFQNPEFQDVPRDRLAAMIMMTVAQTNNLDPESFANSSQIYFIDSGRMSSLIRDAHAGDQSSHFASLDAMVGDLHQLQGRDRTTAEMWGEITQHHAPGSAQRVRRLQDGQQMPLILIDSAAAAQPLSQDDMNEVLGLLGTSAFIRGGITQPRFSGILGFFGVPLGGLTEMMAVYAAANSDPTARKPGESLLDWAERLNPDRTPRERARFRRQLELALPGVQPVISELAAAGSGPGWSWDNGRLLLEDASAYRATVEGMGLTPESREELLLWLDTKFKGRDVTGPVSVDVEQLGALHIIANREPRESNSGGIHSNTNDFPDNYYKPPKDKDNYTFPDGYYSFGTEPEAYRENMSVVEAIEKADLRIAAARHSSDQAKLQLARDEIMEAATDLRTFIEEQHAAGARYKMKILLMNRMVNQWGAKGSSVRGPLTADLARGMFLD